MNKNFKAGAQGGFTLIELIVVIVILGILAATAMPKFMNMSGEARFASVKAAKGALAATSAMVHGKALINPSMTTTTVDGVKIDILNGYPTSASIAAAAGLLVADYTATVYGNRVTVSPVGADAAKCSVYYDNAGAASGPEIKVVATSGDDCM